MCKIKKRNLWGKRQDNNIYWLDWPTKIFWYQNKIHTKFIDWGIISHLMGDQSIKNGFQKENILKLFANLLIKNQVLKQSWISLMVDFWKKIYSIFSYPFSSFSAQLSWQAASSVVILCSMDAHCWVFNLSDSMPWSSYSAWIFCRSNDPKWLKV